jgi:hypothetical protein
MTVPTTLFINFEDNMFSNIDNAIRTATLFCLHTVPLNQFYFDSTTNGLAVVSRQESFWHKLSIFQREALIMLAEEIGEDLYNLHYLKTMLILENYSAAGLAIQCYDIPVLDKEKEETICEMIQRR